MLGALQTIAGLTASPGRRRALREQVQWIAELGERTIAAPHDRARFSSRVALVRSALKAGAISPEDEVTCKQPTKAWK